jgi:hypothetical protein
MTVLFDVTSYLSNTANFQSGDTVTVQAASGTNNRVNGVTAQLVFSYTYDQNVASPTGLKTVQWFVGQKYTAGAADQTGSFVTFIPESSASYKSSAVILDAPAQTQAGLTDTVTAGSATCGASGAGIDNTTTTVTTASPAITRMLNVTSTSMTTMTGQTVNYCLGISGTATDTVTGTAYSTYTVSLVSLPENSIIFSIILVFLPKVIQLLYSVEERERVVLLLRKKQYDKILKSLADPYKIIYKAVMAKLKNKPGKGGGYYESS